MVNKEQLPVQIMLTHGVPTELTVVHCHFRRVVDLPHHTDRCRVVLDHDKVHPGGICGNPPMKLTYDSISPFGGAE